MTFIDTMKIFFLLLFHLIFALVIVAFLCPGFKKAKREAP